MNIFDYMNFAPNMQGATLRPRQDLQGASQERMRLPMRGEPGRQMQQQMPQQQFSSPSQGLFSAYMQQLFDQKYRPQQNLGGYQNMGGYGGFMSPQMPALMAAPRQQQPTSPAMGTDKYGNASNWNASLWGPNTAGP